MPVPVAFPLEKLDLIVNCVEFFTVIIPFILNCDDVKSVILTNCPETRSLGADVINVIIPPAVAEAVAEVNVYVFLTQFRLSPTAMPLK